jgi:hypothetical protein
VAPETQEQTEVQLYGDKTLKQRAAALAATALDNLGMPQLAEVIKVVFKMKTLNFLAVLGVTAFVSAFLEGAKGIVDYLLSPEHPMSAAYYYVKVAINFFESVVGFLKAIVSMSGCLSIFFTGVVAVANMIMDLWEAWSKKKDPREAKFWNLDTVYIVLNNAVQFLVMNAIFPYVGGAAILVPMLDWVIEHGILGQVIEAVVSSAVVTAVRRLIPVAVDWVIRDVCAVGDFISFLWRKIKEFFGVESSRAERRWRNRRRRSIGSRNRPRQTRSTSTAPWSANSRSTARSS